MHDYNKHLTSFYEMFSRPQTTRLQDTPSQLLIFLQASKFSADFRWCGREFHILAPKLLRLLVPEVTRLTTRISKFDLYLLRTFLLGSLSLNISCIKHGFRIFKVLYTSVHKSLSRATFIVGSPDFSKSNS